MLITGIAAEAIRFEFSPLQEAIRALGVLTNPRRHAEQMAWVRTARRAASPALRREIAQFAFLLRKAPELFPDVLPAPRGSSFHDELLLLRRAKTAFTPAIVRRLLDKPLLDRAELDAACRPRALARLARETANRLPEHAAFIQRFASAPEALHTGFCAMMAAFFERCLAADWEAFVRRADDDARSRRGLLERYGATPMLRTLTRELTARGSGRVASIEFARAPAPSVEIAFDARSTLALTPSYFIWPHATFVVLRRTALEVRIAYPLASPSGIRRRRTDFDAAARRYAALADPTRLAMLDLLSERDLSTRELAGLIGRSEAGISRHLTLLRDAGFVTSVRDGYFVLYRLAPAAAAMGLP